jgi:hypothetical protein
MININSKNYPPSKVFAIPLVINSSSFSNVLDLIFYHHLHFFYQLLKIIFACFLLCCLIQRIVCLGLSQNYHCCSKNLSCSFFANLVQIKAFLLFHLCHGQLKGPRQFLNLLNGVCWYSNENYYVLIIGDYYYCLRRYRRLQFQLVFLTCVSS